MTTRHLVLCVLLAGCDRPTDLATTRPEITGPYHVGDSVMWIDATRGLAFALAPALSPPAVKSIAVPRHALYVAGTPSRDRLLVLSPGHDAVRLGELPESASLTVLSGAMTGPKVERRYDLPAPFDRVDVAPDGHTAVAYFSPSPAASDAYFRNPNEMSIIDLDVAPGDGNPVFRTIRSLGNAPLAVAFSPPLGIPAGSAPRTLGVVLAKDYLTLLDLTHPTRPELTIPLVPSGSSNTVTPQQIVFATDSATLLVRADGAPDVFAITLDARSGAGPTENDFQPRINQPSAGRTVRDMMLYSDGGRTLLLTANSQQDLTLIDPATGEFTIVPIGAPVDAVLGVPPDAPDRAVVYSRGGGRSSVDFVDLKGLWQNGARNLSRRTLVRPVRDLVPVPDGGQLLVVHDDARTVVSVLDLGPHRLDTPILGRLPLGSFDFADGGFLVGVSPGLAQLGVLDLVSLSPHDLRLDYDPAKVIAVGGRLVVDHGQSQGLVTVLPRPLAERDEAKVLWGFFLAGALDQEVTP